MVDKRNGLRAQELSRGRTRTLPPTKKGQAVAGGGYRDEYDIQITAPIEPEHRRRSNPRRGKTMSETNDSWLMKEKPGGQAAEPNESEHRLPSFDRG